MSGEIGSTQLGLPFPSGRRITLLAFWLFCVDNKNAQILTGNIENAKLQRFCARTPGFVCLLVKALMYKKSLISNL